LLFSVPVGGLTTGSRVAFDDRPGKFSEPDRANEFLE
jgi:hypothetical protein